MARKSVCLGIGRFFGLFLSFWLLGLCDHQMSFELIITPKSLCLSVVASELLTLLLVMKYSFSPILCIYICLGGILVTICRSIDQDT